MLDVPDSLPSSSGKLECNESKSRPLPFLHVHLKSASQRSLKSPRDPCLSPPPVFWMQHQHSERPASILRHVQEHMIVLEKACASCGARSAIRGGTMVHLGYSEFAFSLKPLMQCPYSHQTLLKHLTCHSKALIRGHNGA